MKVVVFSWPSNGGGDAFLEDIHGVASYKLDKSDARASTEALDRALGRLQELILELNPINRKEIESDAMGLHPDNALDRRQYVAGMFRKHVCPFNVTLLAHSMGNYLFKKMLQSSSERLSENVSFDNVILKAADTNQAGHAEWVEEIRTRHRVYVTINQDDGALAWSNRKIGDAQKPRFGSTIARQDACNATYVDFTGFLGDEHSYFVSGDAPNLSPEQAQQLEDFFREVFSGRAAESQLVYRSDTNTYRFN